MESDASEVFALFVCAVIGGGWIWRTIWRLSVIDRLACASRPRNVFLGMLFGCLVVFLIGLCVVATGEVRANPFYWVLFLLSTVVAFAAAITGLGVLGIDALHDGIERNNAAVRLVVLTLLPTVTICSIGANIGEGSFVGTTFIPQALAVVCLLGLSGIYSVATEAFTVIASDGDRQAAWRFASLLLAWGALLANSAHGDWVSLEETIKSFGYGGAAGAGVLVVAVVNERLLQAKATPQSHLRAVIFPAIANLALAASLFCLLP